MHNEDGEVEDELRLALGRVEAPCGFADEVVRRLGREREPSRLPWGVGQAFEFELETGDEGAGMERQRPSGLGIFGAGQPAAIAAALLFALLLPLIGYLHQRHQQEKAAAAAEQFSLAMRLTHEALEDAGMQIANHRHSRTGE